MNKIQYIFSALSFSLLLSFFTVKGMNKQKTAVCGGVVSYGIYSYNDKKNNDFVNQTKKSYKDELFKQGSVQIKKLNNAITEEIQGSIYGGSYIIPKDLAIINPQLIDAIEPKIEFALKSSIQSTKDDLYDSAGKIIIGGAIVIGGISGFRKKIPFNPQSLVKTVIYGATAGIATTGITAHVIESYPKQITHYGLSLYDKHVEHLALKETKALVRNSIQLTKVALKENGSWNDRWIVNYVIKDNPFTPTLSTGIDKEIANEIISQYNSSKENIQKSIVSNGCNALGKIVPVVLIGSSIATGVNPTTVTIATNGLLFITNSLIKSNVRTNKEVKN